MTTKLVISPHTLLESASLALALAALALSSTIVWHYRGHLQSSQENLDLINAQIGQAEISSLASQEDFQAIETRVESLNNDLWATKQRLEELQKKFSESQQDLQNVQEQITFYQSQISDLEADREILSSCIQSISPVASEMSVIPSYLSNGNGIVDWVLSRGVVGMNAVEAIQDFNSIWNIEPGDCTAARAVARNQE